MSVVGWSDDSALSLEGELLVSPRSAVQSSHLCFSPSVKPIEMSSAVGWGISGANRDRHPG